MKETDFDLILRMLANAEETTSYTVHKNAQERVITFERGDSWYDVEFYFDANGKLFRVE